MYNVDRVVRSLLQLPKGRQSVLHYREVERPCVFSHDELVCKMAAEASSLDMSLAAEIHKELAHIIDREKVMRKKLMDLVSNRNLLLVL